MKLVKSIVRPNKVDEIREALEKLGRTDVARRTHRPRCASTFPSYRLATHLCL